LNGLPRNPGPFLRLLEDTNMPQDYEQVGALTLDSIARIRPPVVLVYGEHSAFLGTYQYLRDHLPDSTTVLLPRTEWGHFGPLEQPEVVAAHLLDHLSADRPSAGDGRVAEPARTA
jgi:pimeloyl-ACP methyl ester carboxylesterase